MTRGAAITLFVLLALEGRTFAQDDSASVRAERLFEEGSALVDRGDYAAGCPKFAESQRLDPAVGTQYNLALCYEKLGKLGSAWRNLREVERIARETGKTNRAELARERMAALRPRVPRLVLSAREADVLISVDGELVDRAEWSFYAVDAGDHAIAATASARKPWQTQVAVAPGAQIAVDVPALEHAVQTRIVTKEKTNVRRTIGFAVGGLGVASIAAAVVTGVLLLDAKSTADASCNPTCATQAGRDAVALGKTLLPINAVAWAVGLVALGAGTLLVVLPSQSAPRATAMIAPWVGPDGAGMSALIRW